jgi:hypothetical protein
METPERMLKDIKTLLALCSAPERDQDDEWYRKFHKLQNRYLPPFGATKEHD